MKFTWKIGGEAGFGILTSGLVFSKIVNRLGYFSFDYIEYPSLIRGGHNALEVVVSDQEVRALKKDIDFLLCLNADTYKFHKHRLNTQSYIIYDGDDFKIEENIGIKISVPFKKILSELKGPLVMKNTIAMGATLGILGCDLNVLTEILEQQFGKKGQEIVDINKRFAQMGYDHVKNSYLQQIKALLSKKESEQKLVMSGNDVFSLASIIADCRVYCAYPMTPSSTVLTTMASWQEKTGLVVRHAEDEISVINTALGATFAGVRAAVGTSGGGFALMVESISFAGIAEMPIVVFLAQRAGPATGMPTWTEQGDLLFAVHAGHGEFPKIVLSPGDVEEMLELTTKAFNLTDIYQTPVIVMSDMLLSESHKSITKHFIDTLSSHYQVTRGKTVTVTSETKYLRYKLSDDGISERLIPGAKGHFYQSNSYEHVEDGHTTEDALARRQQVEKRNKKNQTYLMKDFAKPKVYGDIETANTVFVSWGSNKGPILEAQKILQENGKTSAYIHFTHIYPMDREQVTPFLTMNKKYILVENNSHGQFGKLLLMETGIEIKDKLLKYDGRPFWPEEIVEKVTSSSSLSSS